MRPLGAAVDAEETAELRSELLNAYESATPTPHIASRESSGRRQSRYHQVLARWPWRMIAKERAMSYRFRDAHVLSAVLLPAIVLAASATLSQEMPLAMLPSSPQLKWGPCPEFMPKGCEIAVLHGDPAKPNADIFFKVPGQSKITRHWHTSAERMVLVSGQMQVTYDGQKPVELRPGSYAYGPAKSPHSAVCTTTDACVLFIAFELPVDAHEGAPSSGR